MRKLLSANQRFLLCWVDIFLCYLPSKDHTLNMLGFFLFFLPLSSFDIFCFVVHLSSWFPWSSPSPFNFVELASIMANASITADLVKETQYVGQCMTLTFTHWQDRLKSVVMLWLLITTIPVAVEGHCTWIWPSLFKLLVSVLGLGLSLPCQPICCQIWKVYDIIRTSLNSIWVDSNSVYGEVLSIYEDIYIFVKLSQKIQQLF